MNKVITLCYIICIFFSVNIVCQNIDLLGTLNPHPNNPYSDIWGYTANGREYALLGVTGGTSIIDVTNPASPVEVSFITGPLAPPYEWRDIKTHLNYAYIVSEGTGQGAGMQIVDLSNLPNSAALVGTYNTTFTSAHNLFIADGYAYVVGTSSGGMHILDLANPTNPVQTAYYSASGYIHDVYVWNDTAYASSNNTYDLVNLSVKSNPQLISVSAALPGIYAHSGWLSENKRYFIACEEFNERDITVWDLVDRSSWELVVTEWQTNSNSPVHNPFVLGNYVHVSYYEDGYVVIDISNPENPEFAGQYDTNPGGSFGNYEGSWGVYPYLPSGITIVSDMQNGLYVCRFNPPVTRVDNANHSPVNFKLDQNYPNPFNPATKIKFNIETTGFASLSVYNLLGQNVVTLINNIISAGEHEVEFNASGLPSGIYIARLTSGGKSAFIKMSLTK